MTRLEFILRQAGTNRKLRSALRGAYAEELEKVAQQGILQDYQGEKTNYGTREQLLTERGTSDKADQLYGVNPAEYGTPEIADRPLSESLSTRYVPGKPGVSAERVRGTNGGVYKDPNTNKIYDWNEGFTDEQGQKYQGSSVQGQTEMFSYSEICDPDKLVKTASEDYDIATFGTEAPFVKISVYEDDDEYEGMIAYYKTAEDIEANKLYATGSYLYDKDGSEDPVAGRIYAETLTIHSEPGIDFVLSDRITPDEFLRLMHENFTVVSLTGASYSPPISDEGFDAQFDDFEAKRDWDEGRDEYAGFKISSE
jgi:hypothetical protein